MTDDAALPSTPAAAPACDCRARLAALEREYAALACLQRFRLRSWNVTATCADCGRVLGSTATRERMDALVTAALENATGTEAQ